MCHFFVKLDVSSPDTYVFVYASTRSLLDNTAVALASKEIVDEGIGTKQMYSRDCPWRQCLYLSSRFFHSSV